MIKRFRYGFTIVELLVVIVVIGILAAVTIVAYNGIQTRAENTKTVSAIEQYANALRIYQSDNGEFPLISYNTFLFYCVAESGSCAAMSGSGADCGNLGAVSSNSVLNGQIKTVLSKIPEVSGQTLACQTKTVKGAFYYTIGSGSRNVYVVYYLKGDQPCTTPAASTQYARTFYSDGGTTACSLEFKPI